MPRIAYSSISALAEQLVYSPINEEWIIEGSPKAHGAVLSGSVDQTAFTALWTCTAGKFCWVYYIDETIHFLDGSASIDDGSVLQHFGPGDVVFFPTGTTAVWTVENYVHKLAFCRNALPAPIVMAMKTLRKIKASVRLLRASGFALRAAWRNAGLGRRRGSGRTNGVL
jgi:uncharacterized cupin superfamily protein